MTLSQRTFAEIEVKRARRTDPDTSREAAKQSHGLAAEHVEKIRCALQCIEQQMRSDATAHELAYFTGLTNVQISRRLAEMEEAGLIKPSGNTRPTPSGRPARCWRLTEAAR